MSLVGHLFPVGVLWFFNLLMLPLLFWMTKSIPWVRLIEDKALQHRFFAACVILLLVWRANIDVSLGVAIHFLGITTITLMFGWPLAILAALFAQLGFLFSGIDALDSFALNVFLSGVLPIMVTWGWHCFIDGLRSNNPFVFIMITGFIGCLLACLAVSIAGLGLLLLATPFEFSREAWEYAAFLPLFIVPEAVINGMLLSGFCILHPSWVMAFDDERFFKEPPPNEMILDEEPLPKSMDIDAQETQQETEKEGEKVSESSDTEQDVLTESKSDPDEKYRPPASWHKNSKKDDE